MHWNALQKLIWSIFLWSFFDYCSSTAAFSKLFSVVEVLASLQKLTELRTKDDGRTSRGTISLYSRNLSNILTTYLYQQSIKYFSIYEILGNCDVCYPAESWNVLVNQSGHTWLTSSILCIKFIIITRRKPC